LHVIFQVLADLTVGVHFAFVLFVVFGGLLVIKRPAIAWLHVPAAAWGAWIEFAGWICPLTPLENRLRARGGEATYDASFVERYVMPILYPEALTREVQFVLGGLVVVVNVVVYAAAFTRRRRARAAVERR
jgi:Protein of Unknown function (DUF2784)